MRVLIINTSERTGGAAVAAGRLVDALCNYGVKAMMLVRDKETTKLTVCALPGQKRCQLHFLWERFVVWCHLKFNRKHLFDVDIANSGSDITKLPEFQEADVIHLHWINQGMLSLRNIRQILDSGKPVVWTMHDIWPATAICHLTLDCRRFESGCQHCRLLPEGGAANDLSAQVWHRKVQMLAGHCVSFVACSQWLAGEASKSALLQGHSVVSIPNPIDSHIYSPGLQAAARLLLGLPQEGRIVLFASQRVTNRYKGMSYLVDACQRLARQYPEQTKDLSVAILGGHAEEISGQLPFRTFPLGYINDERRIVAAYQASDVFVLPSLSENLPNTIMEAMACGVPSVAFKIGGIPEEISHLENGYVARYCDSDDLAEGIVWTLYKADRDAVRKSCVQKVAQCYSQQSVAKRYYDLYEDLCNHRHL